MSSACRNLILAALAAFGAAHAGDVHTLRVCSDPNNLPFSNQRGEGFENKLAQLIAADLDTYVTYTWWPQRRGFLRNTLQAGRCDVVIGVPASYGAVSTTTPYYRSTYAFVTRRADRLHIDSFDDARLRSLRIGLHTIGDDYSNVPPAEALARRGIVRNITGYPIYGDYSQPDPPRELIDALARGDLDVAIAWGPLAGYFAQHEPVALDVTPLAPQADDQMLPMRFSISMAVRRDDAALRARLERVISNRRAEIRTLLASYGVPLLPETQAASVAEVHPGS
jgi:quinoprotein dehydrogenase-associated probable ABC transporter substrate-binding protein